RFKRLEYLWRPNYRSISRTRNRGCAAALGDDLVFLNTDVLLNPEGLAAYYQAIKQYPGNTFWGYVGCRKRVRASSIWYPAREVNWLDFRFFPTAADQLWVSPFFGRAPHRFASGHHFGLSRASWEVIGAMDESFVDWGEEDVEYALRGLVKGVGMLLLGDAWAEHLHHPYEEAFHLESPVQNPSKQARIQQLEQALIADGVSAGTATGVLFGPKQMQTLFGHIQNHYLLAQPDALDAEISRVG
ncbi:MAG: hypothetical protein CVV27_06720, partial [Candidatus Melainabacteria bacterium HGW-Melainabacteria-1]